MASSTELPSQPPSLRSSSIQESFSLYKQEIDAYNDRRERLIKISRDVTTQSKRLIFALHRFPHDVLPFNLPSRSKVEGKNIQFAEKIVKEAKEKRDEIVSVIVETANKEGLGEEVHFEDSSSDLQGAKGVRMTVKDGDADIGRADRHEGAMGSGLEEFIEAISFLYFLENGNLITLEEVQRLFICERQGHQLTILPVPAFRYLLGLSDLTGELMRFATNAVGAGDTESVVGQVLRLMRDIRNALDPFIPLIRDMRKKQQVTSQSLRKIENICYAIKVRSSEYGSDPKALQEMVRRSLAGRSSGANGPADGDVMNEEDH